MVETKILSKNVIETLKPFTETWINFPAKFGSIGEKWKRMIHGTFSLLLLVHYNI